MATAYLLALLAIAIALSVLMAGAWLVQQRTGNSGWVDTIWTFSLGLVGAVSALAPSGTVALGSRQWLVAALVAVWSVRLGSHIAARTAKITDDPRYAAFAKEWGVEFTAQDVHLLAEPRFGIDPVGVRDFRRRARAGCRTSRTGLSRRRSSCLTGSRAKRSPMRNSSRSDQSRQQRDGERRRTLELVAAPELLLRMVRLARLSGHRNFVRLSVGLATLLAPIFMFWILNYVDRRSAARRADDKIARRPLSRVPSADQPFLPLAAKDYVICHDPDFPDIASPSVSPLPDAVVSAASTYPVRANGDTNGRRKCGVRCSVRSPVAKRRSPKHAKKPTRNTTKCRRLSLRKCSGRTANIHHASTTIHDSTLAGSRRRRTRSDRGITPASPTANILELGCGWGSLSLWMAGDSLMPRSRRFRIHLAAALYRSEAEARGLTNLTRHHARYERRSMPDRQFDRIVSVEMFEHMMNWRELMTRVRSHG